ncbi:hypothetical protein RaK2_00413 [Klebsiella phage vB_KleM_RaK2]|uniref:Uncharacterized protein n=1 Tax=Klebsiella phage vB_KleM_RaK2 TaxID=1147094 RepID=H6X4M0_9CAUD|nr:hypothetical protein F403_gp122 [Klebsiella phage vB_KleM_RaK2]AFA44686.1 hypothetical protein RaK2_00413 [Klebsiella phage vB_KleM_RaK2]
MFLMSEFEKIIKRCEIYFYHIIKNIGKTKKSTVINCEYKDNGFICYTPENNECYFYFPDPEFGSSGIKTEIPDDVLTEEGYFQYSTIFDDEKLFSMVLMKYFKDNCDFGFSVEAPDCLFDFLQRTVYNENTN